MHSLYLDVIDFIGFHLSGHLIPANLYYDESAISHIAVMVMITSYNNLCSYVACLVTV